MSLAGAYDTNNLFAKILRGELPSVKVHEDEVALAFMDIFPQSKGHTLVIPKDVQARNFLDFPTERVGPFLERVQRVARGVEKALRPDGVVVATYIGAPAGQTIFHLHYHVLPRYVGVNLAGHAHQQRADMNELQALAKQIAAAM